ncbi:MAG TPA: type IV pilin, partial [Candidatus Poseidoniaceae archaeon]|nr:type IV pilin [Candidatus Poseidoniaceae archaeon]
MRQVKRVNYEKAVSPVIATILMVAITVVLSGVLYVWAANLAESNTDGAFEMYTFSASSAPGEMTSDTNDNLIIVTMDQGEDIDWAKIDVKISIAGAASVSCAGPGESTGSCIVLESEPTGNIWEVGEAVTIKENGVDLCDGELCEVTVSIVNNREGVTLDQSSTTAESTPLPENPCYSKVLYNTQTHTVITKSTIDEGGHSTWMLLSESSSNYEHPAYYHKQLHQVLDCSDGDSVSDGNGGTWILTEMSSGGGSHGGGGSGSGDSGSENTETVCDDGIDNDNDGDIDGSDSDCASTPPANPDCDDSYVLYSGHPSHTSYTQQEVIDGSATDWTLLDPNDWPDYNHPAYYYSVNGERDVLDCTQDDSVSGWTLQAPSSGGGSGSGDGGSGDSGSGDGGSGDGSSNANPTCDDS